MRWEDQSEKIALPPAHALLATLAPADRTRVTEAANGLPRLVIAAGCLDRIRAHLGASRDELGGLLIGQAFGDGGAGPEAHVVAVTRNVGTRSFDSTGVSLRMGTGVWDLARPHLDSGALVVGWYHSHPDLGAFFSDTDRATQKSFFRHAFSTGIVIDPIRKELKAYIGPACMEIPAENVIVIHRR